MTFPVTYQATEVKRMQQLKGIPLASFRRRAIAFIIDIFISILLFLATLMIIGTILWYVNTEGELTSFTIQFDTEAWYGRFIVQILVPVLYFGFSTYFTNGQTVGKKLMRIRVVPLTHERIQLWDCIERALGYGASIVEFGFGFLQYFTHPSCRTAEDCLAETIVIDEREEAVQSTRPLRSHVD